ncbi:MAG: endonuclease MutS2 [Oscillatoriales cyanobacterium SM2_2_1]|nr:endonuclease MutS2 [Oscillatoriales cyanobacterium SM2_2_1]
MQQETLGLLEWQRLGQHLATFATTKMGAIAARQLAIPQRRQDTELLLGQTSEAVHLTTTLPQGMPFQGIQDISMAVVRAGKQGVLAAEELLAIAQTLAATRTLRRVLDQASGCPQLQSLIGTVRTYPELEQGIYHCIDDSGAVLDRASEKLGSIRQQLRQQRERMMELLQSLIRRHSSALQDQVILQRGDRYVLSVKAPQKDQVPGVVHDASSSGMTLFVEPTAAVSLNNQMRQLVRQETAELERILRQLSAEVAAVWEDLQHLLETVTILDLAAARARYGLWLRASAPNFAVVEQTITLRQLRHPLLVWQQCHEQGQTVIPIDVTIAPTTQVVVITGPNTGGKTATLKTLGLAVLMAKAGLWVPAQDPVWLPYVDGVYADIGDEQSLQQNLSTFSGHIRRIGRILAVAGADSLVLLDEVGAGTDPTEGTALAIALLRHLSHTCRLTVATTHFGELKALKYQYPGFENASVEFDDATLSPTYHLLWGIPGRSNALAIAQRLGFPEAILDQAQHHLGSGSQELNYVIGELEQQRRQQQEKTIHLSELLTDAERLHGEIQRRYDQLRCHAQELRQRQEQEVHQQIHHAKREIGRLIRRLQAGEPAPQEVQKAEQRLEQIEAHHLPPPPPTPTFLPKAGDRVHVTALGKVALVLTPPNGNGELSVKLGSMKMTVPLSAIAPAPQ